VHFGGDQVFFGATVTYEEESGLQRTVTILGIDEADNLKQQVSWVSPIARTLLRAQVGDVVRLNSPSGVQNIEIIRVDYPKAVPTGDLSH
jgi:transcription elongation factor GreB